MSDDPDMFSKERFVELCETQGGRAAFEYLSEKTNKFGVDLHEHFTLIAAQTGCFDALQDHIDHFIGARARNLSLLVNYAGNTMDREALVFCMKNGVDMLDDGSYILLQIAQKNDIEMFDTLMSYVIHHDHADSRWIFEALNYATEFQCFEMLKHASDAHSNVLAADQDLFQKLTASGDTRLIRYEQLKMFLNNVHGARSEPRIHDAILPQSLEAARNATTEDLGDLMPKGVKRLSVNLNALTCALALGDIENLKRLHVEDAQGITAKDLEVEVVRGIKAHHLMSDDRIAELFQPDMWRGKKRADLEAIYDLLSDLQKDKVLEKLNTCISHMDAFRKRRSAPRLG